MNSFIKVNKLKQRDQKMYTGIKISIDGRGNTVIASKIVKTKEWSSTDGINIYR